MKNTISIISLLLVLQVNWVNPAPVGTTTTQSIVALAERIIAAVNDATMAIVKKNEQVQFLVSTAEDSIKNSLEELVQFIKETKIAASGADVDISSCLDKTVVVGSIDGNGVRRCSNEEELCDLKNQLLDIGNKSSTLVELAENIPGGDTASDIESVVNDIESDLSNLQLKIQGVLSDSLSAARHCTEANLALFDQQVNLISKEFSSCLDEFQEF